MGEKTAKNETNVGSHAIEILFWWIFSPESDRRFSTAQVGTGKSWEKSGDPPTDHLFVGKLPSTKRDPRPAGGVDM